MKNFIIFLSLILVFTSCSVKPENSTESEVASQEEVADNTDKDEKEKEEVVVEEKKNVVEGVKDADFSTDQMIFPEIITNSESKTIAEINKEIKILFDDLKAPYEENISGYDENFVDYFYDIQDEILSLAIRYLEPFNFYNFYRTYNINMETGESYTFDEALAKSGLTERHIEDSIKAFAAADYTKQLGDEDFYSDAVELHTYEDYQNYVYESYTMQKGFNTVPFIIRGETKDLVIFVDSFLIYHDSFTPMKGVAIKEYIYETGVYSANEKQPLAIRYEPSEEEIKKADPKLTYLGLEGEEWTEKFLLSSTTDDLNLKFYTVTFDENTYEMVPDQILEEVTLNKGESILVDIMVPEGMPAYGVEVSKGDMKLSHYFGYNGLFGNSPLEMPVVRE